MSQSIKGQGGHIGSPIVPRSPMLRSCFLSSYVEFHSAVEVENVSAILSKYGHLGFLIGPKNTNFVENVYFLLPVKFIKFRSVV